MATKSFDPQDSIGARATKVAEEVAAAWMDETWTVIQKTILDTANRGLFRCKLHFTDPIPSDPENQARLLKILHKQNLQGRFEQKVRDDDDDEGGIDLTVSWCSDLL